jgi:hypothetical protein
LVSEQEFQRLSNGEGWYGYNRHQHEEICVRLLCQRVGLDKKDLLKLRDLSRNSFDKDWPTFDAFFNEYHASVYIVVDHVCRIEKFFTLAALLSGDYHKQGIVKRFHFQFQRARILKEIEKRPLAVVFPYRPLIKQGGLCVHNRPLNQAAVGWRGTLVLRSQQILTLQTYEAFLAEQFPPEQFQAISDTPQTPRQPSL